MRTASVKQPPSQQEMVSPLKYPDCVYLSEKYSCAVLNLSVCKSCKGEHCGFCRSSEKLSDERIRWLRRMNSLSEQEQQKISACYYQGAMPWKEHA
ncbi:MAG: hypothetical protein ACI4JJ_07805 [Huintestinicola sp.]